MRVRTPNSATKASIELTGGDADPDDRPEDDRYDPEQHDERSQRLLPTGDLADEAGAAGLIEVGRTGRVLREDALYADRGRRDAQRKGNDDRECPTGARISGSATPGEQSRVS